MQIVELHSGAASECWRAVQALKSSFDLRQAVAYVLYSTGTAMSSGSNVANSKHWICAACQLKTTPVISPKAPRVCTSLAGLGGFTVGVSQQTEGV